MGREEARADGSRRFASGVSPMLHFTCPGCRTPLRVREEYAGRKTKCPKCGAAVVVPAPEVQLEEVPDEILEVLPADEVSTSDPGESARPWHCSRDGKQFGPMSAAEAQSAARRGEIRRSDLVWRPGLPGWEPSHKHFAFPMDSRRVIYRRNDTFVGSLPDVMKLAIKAVHRLGYRISNANESLGLLSFQVATTLTRYGGQYSLYIEEVQENSFRVRVEGFQTEGGWGSIINNTLRTPPEARKVLDEMRDLAD
jgi:hypothetical protein